MKGINLETPRLLLRTAVLADAPAIYAYRSDPAVSRYQGRTGSLAAARRQLKLNAAAKPNTPRTWYQLALLKKDGGALIGDIGIHFIDKENSQAELGYTLAPEHQGLGYAAEAVARVVDYLFKQLGKHRVTASADPRNKRSLKLMERLGMRREAYCKKSFWTGKAWADDVLYALLRAEWRPSRLRRQL